MSLSTIERREVDQFLQATSEVLRDATVRTPSGVALLASHPDGKHPFIYTRDLAVAIQTFCEVGAFETAREFGRFLLNVQRPDGSWVSGYDAAGREAIVAPRARATALGILALLAYVRGSGDHEFAGQARDAVEAAAGFTQSQTLNPYLYLVECAEAAPAGGDAPGYDLWDQCAHAQAFALAHKVYGGERYRRLALLIRRAIGLLMTQDARFLRRLDPHGYPDPRPDVALIAPYYFGLWAPTERTVVNSAELIERTLWNVEIGGYIRRLPYSAAERSVLPGTWPQCAAWMAQYHFEVGNRDRAEAILRWLLDQAANGRLPEVVVPAAVVRRYGPEYQQRLLALDSGDALAPPQAEALGVARDRLLRDYEALVAQAQEHGIARSGAPHTWAHLETLRALKRGSLLEDFGPEELLAAGDGGSKEQRPASPGSDS